MGAQGVYGSMMTVLWLWRHEAVLILGLNLSGPGENQESYTPYEACALQTLYFILWPFITGSDDFKWIWTQCHESFEELFWCQNATYGPSSFNFIIYIWAFKTLFHEKCPSYLVSIFYLLSFNQSHKNYTKNVFCKNFRLLFLKALIILCSFSKHYSVRSK